ncbi:RNA-binding protein [Candidatus Woesearchaeota archaeon]|nr:RNA-binding protein [Candidatus Woesearchaeota archaeon]
MDLRVQDKEVVVPGQVVATGMEYLPADGAYRLDDEIRANRLGLIKIEGKVIKSIPLTGVYLPQKNDVVVGRVIDILMSGWRLDINSPYSAVLPIKDATFDFIAKGADLTKYFDLDDYVVAKIIQVTSQNLVDVTCKGQGLHKLDGGRILKVGPHKVPRIIGTKGSMITMVKKATNCRVIVGQNGRIWLSGEPDKEHVAVKAIKMIEDLAHTVGLTEQVKSFLAEQTGLSADALTVKEEDLVAERPKDEQRHRRPPRRSGGTRDGPRRRPYGERRQRR